MTHLRMREVSVSTARHSLSDMINNYFCSMLHIHIPHVKNSHKFYLPPTVLPPSLPTWADRIKSRVTGTRVVVLFVTGLVARSVSAARLGSETMLPGLRARVFASSSCLTFFVFESESSSSSSASLVSHLRSTLEHCQ